MVVEIAEGAPPLTGMEILPHVRPAIGEDIRLQLPQHLVNLFILPAKAACLRKPRRVVSLMGKR